MKISWNKNNSVSITPSTLNMNASTTQVTA